MKNTYTEKLPQEASLNRKAPYETRPYSVKDSLTVTDREDLARAERALDKFYTGRSVYPDRCTD